MSTIVCGMFLAQTILATRVSAGLGSLNPDGTVSLTYTYVTPPGQELTAAEIASVEVALEEASRHVCRATDGLIRINHWTIDPGIKETYADVVAYARTVGRANAPGRPGVSGDKVSMFNNDFADESTIAHELGHYVLGLPDMYRAGGESGFGVGGAFTELNSAFSTALTNTQNTFLESQFALDSAGLEYQLTFDGQYDPERGNDNTNEAVDEAFPTPSATTQLVISSLGIGSTGTAQEVDTSNLQAAIDTAQRSQVVMVTDTGGLILNRNTFEAKNQDVYVWGESCEFGRGIIRT